MMSVTKLNRKERIWMTKIVYSVLKDHIKEDECGRIASGGSTTRADGAQAPAIAGNARKPPQAPPTDFEQKNEGRRSRR
jgi:hypothetical protein